jgi:biotin carboxyl carrier protein
VTRSLRISSEFGEWTVAVDGSRIELADPPSIVTVTESGDDRYAVGDAERHWTMAAARAGQRVWIAVDGHALEFAIEETAAARPKPVRDQDALTPPMPSTVARILVGPGQAVERGDILLVLEAMKMELPLRAPRAGTVGALLCVEGQLVQPGDLLIEFK